MKLSRTATLAVTVATLLVAVVVATALHERQARLTEAEAVSQQARVEAIARRNAAPAFDAERLQGLPEPVQRYLRHAFRGPVPAYRLVRLSTTGEFRQPGSTSLRSASAEQISAASVPALAWSSTQALALPGLAARALDLYADGQMRLKARVASLHDTLDEPPSPALNLNGLRRWLRDTPLYPVALLPGGLVSWEPVDAGHARAVVNWQGQRVSLVASIAADGALTEWRAEADGDLDAPWHGAGEHVAFGDYRLIDFQMVPMEFTVSRVVRGQLQPFWRATVEDIAFQ